MQSVEFEFGTGGSECIKRIVTNKALNGTKPTCGFDGLRLINSSESECETGVT